MSAFAWTLLAVGTAVLAIGALFRIRQARQMVADAPFKRYADQAMAILTPDDAALPYACQLCDTTKVVLYEELRWCVTCDGPPPEIRRQPS